MPTSVTGHPRGRATINRKSRLALTVQHATAPAGLPARATLRRWIERALEPGAAPVSMTLRFVGAAEGRRLNRDFRGRDCATNVLTFVHDDADDGAQLSGDLVLCVPVIRREAHQQRKTFRAHCAHLVIHGTLHLQGYDHETDKDATVMEALETRLLASLRYGDPYE